jgi:dTDP-4-dehydrorhamnose reductase
MKVLVTGANGQLGSELKTLANKHNDIDFIFADINELDITDKNQVSNLIQSLKPNFLVNCAAYTAVDNAEKNAEEAFKVNAVGPQNLAEAARKAGVNLIHISTDYVFNGMSWIPYTEDCPTTPQSVYGESKHKGEEMVLASGVGMVIRTSWLYSEFGNNFVKTISKKCKESSSLRVVYDQIGSPTWANNLAEAIIGIIVKGNNHFLPEVFHFSNEGVCSWYDIAVEISRFRNSNCQIIPILTADYKTIANRPPFSVLNKSKIKKAYEISIPHWRDSLISCLHNIE